MYGKRRVGKTGLIKHFATGKPFVYYVAEKQTAKEQLRQAGKAFIEGLGTLGLASIRFTGWRELFMLMLMNRSILIYFQVGILISSNLL